MFDRILLVFIMGLPPLQNIYLSVNMTDVQYMAYYENDTYYKIHLFVFQNSHIKTVKEMTWRKHNGK